MARFYFDKNTCEYIVDGKYFNAPFCYQSDDIIVLSAFYDDCKVDGLIDIKNQKVYGVRLIDWLNGNYDVICNNSYKREYSTPTPLCQKSINYLENDIGITIYYDGSLNVLCECNSLIQNFPLPLALKNYDILFSETGAGLLIVIIGNVDEKQFLSIYFFDGDFQKCVDTINDDISFSTDGFTTVDFLHDMLERTRYTNYSFNGKQLQKNIKFAYKHEKHDLLPYLFLEALLVNDDIYKSYLSKEMTASRESFMEFFGRFDTIECPKYTNFKKISDLNEVAIYSKKDTGIIKPRFYTFEIKDNKITNILC